MEIVEDLNENTVKGLGLFIIHSVSGDKGRLDTAADRASH